MIWGRRLIYITVATLMLLQFQNCTPNRFTAEDIGGMLTAVRRGGDGQVFDGKLIILHNIVDGYTCEGRLAPESILIHDTNNVWSWIQNSPDKCASDEKVIDSSLVNYDAGSKTALYDGKTYVPPRPYFVQALGDANTADANVKDGVCADTSGRCSLRAATDQASATALTDAVVVNVPAGTYKLTAPLIVSIPVDANAIKITGQGSADTVLDGEGSQPHFRIHSLTNKTITIEKLRLINGWDPVAIHAASIQISADPSFYGPMTAPDASVSINDCVFQNNSNGSGVIAVSPNSGALQIHRTQIMDSNTHGVYVDKSNGLLIEDSHFARVSNRGVAVVDNKNAVTIRNSSFTESYEAINFYNCSNCLLENITVTRSAASGLFMTSFLKATENPNPNYNTVIRNSTIYDNATMPMAGQYRSNLSFASENPAVRLTISNSILGMPSTSVSPNCQAIPGYAQNFIAAHNIATDTTCGFSDSSNKVMDPMLEPLGNNGGPSLTLNPKAGSPAIDAGSNALCSAQDQRRLPRPVAKLSSSAICDIGAVEVQ